MKKREKLLAIDEENESRSDVIGALRRLDLRLKASKAISFKIFAFCILLHENVSPMHFDFCGVPQS